MKKFLTLLLFGFSVVAHGQGPNVGVAVQIQPAIGNGTFCMDAKGGHDQDGVPVNVFQCHGSENQRWTITSSTNNERAIIGIGGYCLDVRGSNSTSSGTPTELWKCHFGDNQRFSLKPDGRIVEVRSGKCLAAVAAHDGAPIVLNKCQNIPQEVFMIHR